MLSATRMLLLTLLFPSLLAAEVKYASQIEVPAGKLVVLSATVADSTEWLLVNPPPDDNHQIFEGGAKVVFSSGAAGDYVFAESAATLIDGKVKQKLLLHLVKVGKPVGPTPGPDPVTPTPKPLPEGRFGLAELTRQAVLKAPGIDRALCAQLAGNFGTIAAQIAAGTITTFTDANTRLKARNQATYKGVESQWKPVTDAIGARLNELVATKKLSTTDLSAVQAAFEEIRDGFAAAGN